MKISDETNREKELSDSPKVAVDDKEFRPFESDGEFWGMLNAIEEKSIREYEEKKRMDGLNNP